MSFRQQFLAAIDLDSSEDEHGNRDVAQEEKLSGEMSIAKRVQSSLRPTPVVACGQEAGACIDLDQADASDPDARKAKRGRFHVNGLAEDLSASSNPLVVSCSSVGTAASAVSSSNSRGPAFRSASAGPVFLNRLLDGVGPGGPPVTEELSLQDIFERHPSCDGRPPLEVLIANFMIDLSWLLDECPTLQQVPELTVLQGDGGQGCESAALARSHLGLKTHIHSPPLPLQWGTHHSKLALLLYADCIRVCIRTFNDIFPDFYHKSQGIFLQDFPARRETNADHANNVSRVCGIKFDAFGSDFGIHLKRYLDRCGGFSVSCLDRYDFSTAAAGLVASVPGYHRGREMRFWGHLRLRDLLATNATLPSCTVIEDRVLCQFSSLGTLSEKWLDEFHTSLAAIRHFGDRRNPGRPPLLLVMPTVSQVRDSFEGWVAGVSLHARLSQLKSWFQAKWRKWGAADANDNSRAAVRARNAMPHVKSYCRYVQRHGRFPAILWQFVGSQNLSKAAWGEMQKNGTQLCIRSYELGVALFPWRLHMLERDPERRKGHFWRVRADCTNNSTSHDVACPVFVSSEGQGERGTSDEAANMVAEQPIVCPTQVPPAGPPEPGDSIWVKDLEHPEQAGFDRFGSRLGERAACFYGYRAARTRS